MVGLKCPTMDFQMGVRKPCLVFPWVFSLLCGLHLSMNCFGSDLVFSKIDNNCTYPISAPAHSNTETAPPVSGCATAGGKTRRAANTSHPAYTILDFGKRFRRTICVTSLRSSFSTGETVPTPKKAPEDYAHPSQWHPPGREDALPSSVGRGKKSSHTKPLLPSLKNTRALADFRRKEEISQNLDSAISVPHLKLSQTIYTTTLDVKGKAFDTTRGSFQCSKLRAKTSLGYRQNRPQCRKVRQDEANSSASSSNGRHRSSSTSSSKCNDASYAGHGSGTRRSLTSYEGNIKTSSRTSSEAKHSKLETFDSRTTLRFDPLLKRAASRSCWRSRRKNNAPCTDHQRWSGGSSSGRRSPTKSNEHTSSSTNKNTAVVDRSQFARNRGSGNSRSMDNSGTKSRALSTKSSKVHPKKYSNGSSYSSTTNSKGNSVSTNKSKGRAITEDSDTSGATGHPRRSGPQSDSTDRETQRQRPVAIIRLRLCHFTDFHSAYEFDKAHPLRSFPSCCPQNAATSVFGDNEIDQSTASCPAKKGCTSKHEEDAAVVGGYDGGIWRVPVLQYILDNLCPYVSPASAPAFQSPRPSASIKRRTPELKHTSATAVTPADAGRWDAANTSVKEETSLDAEADHHNYVRRDAFAVRATGVGERKYTTGYPAEKARRDVQEEQRRRTEARPSVKVPHGRKIRGYPLREGSRRLLKLRKASNETLTRKRPHPNSKGGTATYSFRECPMLTPSAATESSPATIDLKCNGGSVLKTRNGYKLTSHSRSHPTQTKGNVQENAPIRSSECNTGGQESSTLRAKKGVKHILREGKNYNTRSTRRLSDLKTQSSNRQGSNCRNCCCCANSTSGSKDNSTPTKEGNRGYDTTLSRGTDETAPRAESCSEQAEEETLCSRSALSECDPTKVQEKSEVPVVQNEPEDIVQVVPYSLRLFGGDSVPGSDFDALGAELPGKLLKELKIQVATLGNHEFDRGWQVVDEMFAGNQNFTTFVVSNAFTDSRLKKKARNLFSANSLRALHDAMLHSVSAEEPKMQSAWQSTSTVAEALSPHIKLTRHLTARQTTYRKKTAPRQSTDPECTLCHCSFTRSSRMLGETFHVPRCARTSVMPRLIRQQPLTRALEERKPSFSKTAQKITHPFIEQTSEHLHKGVPSAAGSAFPPDNAGKLSQQSEPDRSEYTVPYVLWLANVHGDFVLLKPQQLADIHRVCRAREAETSVPGAFSADAGGAAASVTRPGSAESSAEAESERESDSFMSLLRVKQPAAAVCLLGALPKDLRTSAAPPADVDVRSENSTQKTELALRRCTESYWKLLRSCSEALQQPSRQRFQHLSRDTQLRRKTEQPVRPGEQHRETLQQQMQPHLGQRSSSCPDSGLQPWRLTKPRTNRSGRHQQTKHRHVMAVRGRLTQRKVGRSEKEQRGAAGVLLSAPQLEQSEQQRPHVDNVGTRTAATTASKSCPSLKDSREGRPKKLPSRSAQQEWLTDRSWAQSAFRFEDDSFHLDTGGQRMNAPVLPRPVGILLSHLGFKEEQRVAAESGGAAGGIDFIFSGHSHTELPSHMFPAFVKQMKTEQTEATRTGDAAGAQSLPSNVAALTVGGSDEDFPNVSVVAGANGGVEENRARMVERQGEGKEDAKKPDSEDQDGEGEVEEVGTGQPQATPQMNTRREDDQQQEVKNSHKKNWQCNDNVDTEQLQSSKSSKQRRSPKNGHIHPTKQCSNLEKQHISCGRNKQCSSTNKRSRSTRDHRNNRLDQHSDSARQHSPSSFHENISPPRSSNAWQSGSFIITSASHGKRISFVDIYFLVSDQGGGETKGRTHVDGEGGISTEGERENGIEDDRQQARTDADEERQNARGEDLDRKVSHNTTLKDVSRADKIDDTPSHRDKSAWWLQSEQLPPVFSTVNVDDFAAWAASAKSFLRKPIAGDIAETGRKIRTVSSWVAVERKTATRKAAAPDCAASQTETTLLVQGGGVATGPGDRSSVNEEREAWSNDATLHVPSRDAAVSKQRDKSHSQVPSQRALSCERNCNSHATTNSNLSKSHGRSSGFLSELHGAAVYEFVCLDKTYGESSPLQQQRGLQGAEKSTSVFMQSFVDTPHTTGDDGVPFNTETMTQRIYGATAQQRAVEALPEESTPALTRTDLKPISVAERNRRAAGVATEAAVVTTMHPYFRCSSTTQPIPSLSSHSSSFSFSRHHSNDLARSVQPNQSTVEAAPTSTNLNLGTTSFSFVACLPQQYSSQSSAKPHDIYRIPYFGWLPAHSTRTAFARPRSEQLETGKQQQLQQREYDSCQHRQEQTSSTPESYSPHHQSSCHRQQQQQQQQRTGSPTKKPPRRRPHATAESHHLASKQQLRQDTENQVQSVSVESSLLPIDITTVSRERCYRLSSPLPLFPALSPPAQPHPILPYRDTMQPAQSQAGFSASSLLTGNNDAEGAASTGDSTDVAAVTVAAVEGHLSIEHIFCRAAINAALVCPYSKTINNLRYERRTQSRSRGVAAAEGVDGSFDQCRRSECPMGRLVSDALRYTALKALLWRPTAENEYTATTGEAAETVPTVPSETGETARVLGTTVSILTPATAIRRPGKGAATATGRTAPSKRTANADRFGRKSRKDMRRYPEEEQRTEQNNVAARDTGAELGRSDCDTDEPMGCKEGASYTLNQTELEGSLNHRNTTQGPVYKGNDTCARCNTILENRKAHIRDKKRNHVNASLRSKIAEGRSRATVEAKGRGAVPPSAPDVSCLQHKGVEETKKKWSLDAELVSMDNTEKRPQFEQEKDRQLLHWENVCDTQPFLAEDRKETSEGFWAESQQYSMKIRGKSSRGSGKPRNQKKQQQQQQQSREEKQKKQPKKRKWIWQKQREEKSEQRRKVHQPVVQQPTESARMQQQRINQQESEKFVEQRNSMMFGSAKRTYLGVVAMQTSGNVRSSFCPNCPLTDAEIENVLPWSSHLRVIKLPIRDFLVLSSRSAQKLMNSGSCVLNTPEAAHLFPHLSRCKVAASGRQSTPEPKAPQLSLPHHRSRCRACITRTHQEHVIDNSLAPCKRNRLCLYSKYYSRWGSLRTSSRSSGNSACDRDRCAWKSSSENDTNSCGRTSIKRDKQEDIGCTVLPFCAPGEKENALESPSILQLAGARLEIRLLQRCSRAKRSSAAKARTDGPNHVQILEPRGFQVPSAGSRHAIEDTSQQISQYFPSPALKKKTSDTKFSSPNANECKYKESSSSTQPCGRIQRDKSSHATLVAKPEDKQVSSSPSLHAAKLSVYIPVYPLPVAVEALQSEQTDFQYLFRGKGVSTGGFLNDRQEGKSTKDDGAKTTTEEREEGIDYLWVKVETTQLLGIRINGNAKGRCSVEEREARRRDKYEDERLSVVDNPAGNNHEFRSGRPEECKGWQREKKREKASRPRYEKRKGDKDDDDDEKDRMIDEKMEIEELKRKNMVNVYKEQPDGKLGQRRKIEAEEAVEEEEGREPTENLLTGATNLPVYVQQRLLQQQPLLLQHLEGILRPNITDAHASTGTLMPCRWRNQGSQGDTQSTQFRSFSSLTGATAENEYSSTKYNEANEHSTLLPLCWVRQRITPAGKGKNNGAKQLKQGRTRQRRRMETGTSACAFSREDASGADGKKSGQRNKTQIQPAAHMRGGQTFHFHRDDEPLRMVLHRPDIKQQANSQQPGPTRHQRNSGARQLTEKQGRKRKRLQQIASVPAFSNTHQPETPVAPEDKLPDSKPSEEEPAVVPLSSILLLGVADQFFLQGGDQLLLNDDAYTFNATPLPAVRPSRMTVHNNASTLRSERRKDRDQCSSQALQRREEGQHHKQQSQDEQQPHGQQHRDIFLSETRGPLAVDALFNNKTARDALAEFIQMKYDRNERIGASSFQRLLIHLGH